MIRFSLLIYFTASLVGCATVETTQTIAFTDISGDNRELQDLLIHRYECFQEASSQQSRFSGSASDTSSAARAAIAGQSGRRCSSSAFAACLAARGWLRDDDAVGSRGSITVPQGAVVQCPDP